VLTLRRMRVLLSCCVTLRALVIALPEVVFGECVLLSSAAANMRMTCYDEIDTRVRRLQFT
jgi:hypothetical protein